MCVYSIEMKQIHTFGDSHSSFGWRHIQNVNINHLGPVLCHTIGKYDQNRLNIKNYGVKNNDTVIFSFGEIDCRCHIYKHVTNKLSYREIIDSIVTNYFRTINKNVEVFTNLRVCVYNIVPPIEKSLKTENPSFPYLGTDEERKSYVLYFNEKLKEQCLLNDFIFFDIYDKYTDDRGFLKNELSDGNVHIDNPIYIKEFLETRLKL